MINVDSIQPGPILDAIVAEKVMGLGPDQHGSADHQKYGCCRLRAYSTDIAAAWEVVEKLRNRGIMLTIDVAPSGYDVQHQSSGASGPTFPLAVCRAALNAVGIL